MLPVSCFVVLFYVLFRLQLSVARPNRSQVVRIELPCISVSQCSFTQERLLKLQPFLCEGAPNSIVRFLKDVITIV